METGKSEECSGFFRLYLFLCEKRWDRTGVPVGILNVSLGGAKIEAFMSREMLNGYDDCLAEAERYAQDDWRKEQEEKNEQSTAEWYGRLQEEDAGIKGAWMQEEAWNKNEESGRKEEKAEHRDDSSRIDVPFFSETPATGDSAAVSGWQDILR